MKSLMKDISLDVISGWSSDLPSLRLDLYHYEEKNPPFVSCHHTMGEVSLSGAKFWMSDLPF